MNQQDEMVKQAGRMATVMRYVMERFWFILSGLLAVMVWGLFERILEAVLTRPKATFVAGVVSVAIWLVVFCLTVMKMVETAEDEELRKG